MQETIRNPNENETEDLVKQRKNLGQIFLGLILFRHAFSSCSPVDYFRFYPRRPKLCYVAS